MNPEYPGMNPELPGIIPEKPGTNPEYPGNSTPQSNIPDPQSEVPNPHSPTPFLNTTNQELLDAAAELPFRVQGRSRFDKLPPQEQAAIIGLLGVYKADVVLDLIAQPRPIGFSLKVGKSALYDFRFRYQKREAKRSRKETAGRALDFLNQTENPLQAFTAKYERLLQAQALAAAGDPQASLEELDQITTTLTKFAKQALAERKQCHAERVKNQKFAAS